MKKYLKLLPVIIYPYAYIIAIAVYLFFIFVFEDFCDTKFAEYTAISIFYFYQALTLGMAIYGSVCAAGKSYTAKDAAKVNMIVKGAHIPAYLLHFIMGFLGLCMGIWGLGFLIFAIIVDVITIIVSGIHSIGCMVKMKKENVLSTSKAIFFGICSFVFCIDVVVAIIIMYKCYKRKDNKNITKKTYEVIE